MLTGARIVGGEACRPDPNDSNKGSLVSTAALDEHARDLLPRSLGGACSSNFTSLKMSSSWDEDSSEVPLPFSPDIKSDELLWARVRMFPRDKNGELWFLGPPCRIGVGESSSGE